MRILILILLLTLSAHTYADEQDDFTAVDVLKMSGGFAGELDDLVNYNNTAKIALITKCVDEYIKKQSKSYSRIAQENLYNLIHNFDRITSRIYGQKETPDNVSYENKIEALAKVQCGVYFKMEILK